MEEILENLKCSICLGIINNPITLSCGHSFCKSCITVHSLSNDIEKCPLDNKEIIIHFNTNIILKNLIDIYSKNKLIKLEENNQFDKCILYDNNLTKNKISKIESLIEFYKINNNFDKLLDLIYYSPKYNRRFIRISIEKYLKFNMPDIHKNYIEKCKGKNYLFYNKKNKCIKINFIDKLKSIKKTINLSIDKLLFYKWCIDINFFEILNFKDINNFIIENDL